MSMDNHPDKIARDAYMQIMKHCLPRNLASLNEMREIILVACRKAASTKSEAVSIAPKESPWQPIETAPKGEPAHELGEYESSEWFLALHKSGRCEVIRRLPTTYSYKFKNIDETFYTESCFTHWTPLPPPPKQEVEG